MNAPIIWIGLPGVMGITLWFLRKDERRTLFLALFFSLFLIFSSIFGKVDKAIIEIGSFTFQISSSITILGRTFSLGNGDLIIVSFLFMILFFYISMAFVIDVPAKFVPIAFLLVSLFLAALSVQPFLYAALLLEICAILAVTLFTDYGNKPSRGVMRFVIYQTLAMPFILTSGWVLSAVEANPTETKLIVQALVLLGLGFSFWVGVFPFNSWMSQIAGERPPFEVGFILLLFNTVVLVLIIRYLNGFVWLRDDARIFAILRFLGLLMVVSSAILFLMERNVFRTTAYIISYETGLSILSLSLNKLAGWDAFVFMFLPRILAIALWSVLLSYIQQSEAQKEEGNKIYHPIILVGFALSALTFTGVPFLPAFPSRILLFSELANVDHTVLIWLSIACIVFAGASIKFLAEVYKRTRKWTLQPLPIVEKIYLYLFASTLIISGLLPQMFMQRMLTILEAFPNLR
jgi:formate hydrogenlyase subunit 3/multisubunit Na+/H+ antiporter MnhD subunit